MSFQVCPVCGAPASGKVYFDGSREMTCGAVIDEIGDIYDVYDDYADRHIYACPNSLDVVNKLRAKIAELEAQLAEKEKDAAVGRAMAKLWTRDEEWEVNCYHGVFTVGMIDDDGKWIMHADGDTPYAALDAAGLMDEEGEDGR